MPEDAELKRLGELRDSLDASIKKLSGDGAYRASFDGMYDVTRIEIDRLRKERDLANVQYTMRVAFLNGEDPHFGGSLRRRFGVYAEDSNA